MNSLHSSVISQVTHRLLTVLSLTVVVSFALWWFSAGNIPHNFTGQKHLLDLVLFLLVSYVIWHPIFMEILTWSISWHITETKEITPPKGLRVAFLTTIVPSNESLSLLHQCLPAMVNADYPHDTWLLDEGNSPEVKAICEQYGVFHFSRFRRRLYNTRKGKFVKKTKGGNHNSWYENFDADYDIVAQIDTDFVPQANFLTKTLGYFRDPNIAFVGTPQVYGNGEDSFIAKGAGEQLFSFYGTILRGLSGMKSSLLIGANHIIRVAALKDVDHYSAHITEDLLTGMKLHKKGWKSVYVPEILAVGEGPFTWEAYFAQQMRWAYGCMDILFYQSPKLFLTMGIRRTIYYFALQQHYFSGLAMGISLVLLSLYFATGVQAANVNNVLFMAFYSLIVLLSWLTSVWLQRYNVNQVESHELLLFGKMLSIASWPIYFIAFICAILRKRITYKVTPKGDSGTKFMESYRVFLPHFFFAFIALAGLLSSFFTHRQSAIMIFWALSTVVLMLCVPFMHLLTKAVNTASSRIAKVLSFIRTQNNRGEVLITQQQIQAEYTENALLLDMLFLGGIVVSSVLFYINKIGFYTDDWSFIGNFYDCHDTQYFHATATELL
jgi:cellulose synthase (UDP-forming)